MHTKPVCQSSKAVLRAQPVGQTSYYQRIILPAHLRLNGSDDNIMQCPKLAACSNRVAAAAGKLRHSTSTGAY
jgi:hypothetical protein